MRNSCQHRVGILKPKIAERNPNCHLIIRFARLRRFDDDLPGIDRVVRLFRYGDPGGRISEQRRELKGLLVDDRAGPLGRVQGQLGLEQEAPDLANSILCDIVVESPCHEAKGILVPESASSDIGHGSPLWCKQQFLRKRLDERLRKSHRTAAHVRHDMPFPLIVDKIRCLTQTISPCLSTCMSVEIDPNRPIAQDPPDLLGLRRTGDLHLSIETRGEPCKRCRRDILVDHVLGEDGKSGSLGRIESGDHEQIGLVPSAQLLRFVLTQSGYETEPLVEGSGRNSTNLFSREIQVGGRGDKPQVGDGIPQRRNMIPAGRFQEILVIPVCISEKDDHGGLRPGPERISRKEE